MSTNVKSTKPKSQTAEYWRKKKQEQRKADPERERETWNRYYNRNKTRIQKQRTAYMREYRKRVKQRNEIGGDLNDESLA